MTVGYGFNMTEPIYKNLSKKHGSNHDLILQDLADVAMRDADEYSGGLAKYPEGVQEALGDMSYNMGRNRLFKFKKMQKALLSNDYDTAGQELLNSDYARQLPNRAKRNFDLMGSK